MKSSEIMQTLLDEGFSTSVVTVAMFAREINRTKPVEMDHINNAGSYENEIEDYVRDMMWQEDGIDIERGLEVWKVLYDYEIAVALDGLGGCKSKSVRALLEEKLQ